MSRSNTVCASVLTFQFILRIYSPLGIHAVFVSVLFFFLVRVLGETSAYAELSVSEEIVDSHKYGQMDSRLFKSLLSRHDNSW